MTASGVRGAVLGTCLLGVLQLARFLDPRWAIDDAWVSFRYAHNLLLTGQLTYDPSAVPVEGMTNLLWTLLATLWLALAPEADPIWGARVLGGACHLAAIVTVALLAARVVGRAGGSPALGAATAGGLFAVNGNLAFFAMSGLETPLWVLLFVLAVERADAAWEAPTVRRPALVLGVLLGLLALCRPEGVLLGLLFCAALAARPRTALVAAIPFALVCAGMEGFRLAWFGDLVPNTFHAKPGPLSDGVDYLADALVYGFGFVGLAAAGPALRRLPAARVLAAILLVMAAGTAWTGGDWMPGLRRLAIPTVGGALLCGVGLAIADRRAWGTVAIAAWLVAAAVALGTGWDRTRQVAWEADVFARAANDTDGVDSVALADIGRFGYFFDGPIFDLVGLTDRHIAGLQGDHGAKEWDEAYFRRHPPALVLVRADAPFVDPLPEEPRVGTTEHGILASMVERGGYRYHCSLDLGLPKSGYWLLFSRDDVALPVELWGPSSPKGFKELILELRTREAER